MSNKPNPFLLSQSESPCAGTCHTEPVAEHYTQGDVECIEAIRAAIGPEQFIGHCRANILKYVWRYRLKGGLADLKKAADYLDWLIDAEQNRDETS